MVVAWSTEVRIVDEGMVVSRVEFDSMRTRKYEDIAYGSGGCDCPACLYAA